VIGWHGRNGATRSIRRDLTVQVVTWVLPLIVLGSVAVYVAVRQLVLREFDSALRRQMQVLAAAAERVGTGIDFDYGPETDPGTAFDAGLDYFYQVTLSDGSVLKQSADLHGTRLEMRPGAQGQMRIGPVMLPSGKVGRGCVYVFEPRREAPESVHSDIDRPDAPPGPLQIVIAATTGDIDRPLVALALVEFLVGAVLIGVTILALLRAVRSGLAPVEELAHQVGSIEPGNLAARVNIDGQPAELTPIAARLNDLLARVEEAFLREHRFTANAAHELRTPIAEIRAIAEVTAGSSDDGERAKSLAEIVKVCEEMHATITTLLAIARTKSGALKIEPRPVDVSTSLQDWCAKRTTGRAASARFSCTIAPGLSAETDPAVLGSVVGNLIDNALAYTPGSGTIEARAHAVDSGIRFTVENTCAGLVEADLRDMFDPFWRKRGTTVEGNHSGLGLALVRALCDALGASVWAQLVNQQRLAVCVQLPATFPR
jgi:two-component system sensor histidine kinase QseC